MGLREEKKQQQRSDILSAATALFLERGYDATRVQDIIERVRISEATFFNYFPTKDALLEEFAVERIRDYAGVVQAEINASDRSVPDRIRDLLRVIGIGISRMDREFMAVVATRSSLFFGANGASFEKKVLAKSLLSDLLREGQARGEVREDIPAQAMAESLTGAYSFTIVGWLTRRSGGSDALQARLMRVADLFLEGCRPRAESTNTNHQRKEESHADPHRQRHRR